MELKEILVPYDNSEFSSRALGYAVDLAETVFLANQKNQVVKVTLLHVVPQTPMTKSYLEGSIRQSSGQSSGEVLPFSEYTMTVYDEMRKFMEMEKEMYKSREGINIEIVLLYGNPFSKIIEYADGNKIDLLVIGSKGVRGLSRVVKGLGLGSVSRNVSEKVTCPIVIIR